MPTETAAQEVPPDEVAPQRQAATEIAAAEPADNPRDLAAQIVMVEQQIREPSFTGRALAEAGHLQQAAYRRLADTPRWDDRVLANVPQSMRPTVRAHVAAQRELSSMSSGPPPKTLPEWRIIRPAPRDELRGFYRKAQRRFGVPWYYLAAIHLVETRMGRIRGVSTADAKGPMQFIPTTWDAYGRGDIWDNHDAIMAAGRYLRSRGAPGNMQRALYSYNNDVRYVRAVSAYAHQMRHDPAAYRGYYHWQVYYRQKDGAVWLPVGFDGRQ